MKDAADIWPSLQIERSRDETSSRILGGPWALDAEFNGVRLVKLYQLKIVVPDDYPNKLPKVYETSGAITPSFSHRDFDGSLCMGTYSQIALELGQNPTLIDLITGPMTSCLYSEAYLERYGSYPFGERAHGLPGTLSFIKELFQVESDESARGLLEALANNRYRGHEPCPCESGIIGRKCHGPLITKLLHSHVTWAFQEDLKQLDRGLKHQIWRQHESQKALATLYERSSHERW